MKPLTPSGSSSTSVHVVPSRIAQTKHGPVRTGILAAAVGPEQALMWVILVAAWSCWRREHQPDDAPCQTQQMTATTRLLLESAHGTSDPAVLTEAAEGPGSVTPDDIRRIADMKIPDYSQKFGEPVSADRAAKIVRQAARAMGISVTDRP